MAPYNTGTGFITTQLAFAASGSNTDLYKRQGSGTTWGSWDKFLTQGNSGIGPFLPLAGGIMTGTGFVQFPDNFDLYLGSATNGDFQAYHDGSNTYLRNLNGNFIIKQDKVDADLILESDDGAGGTTPYITLDGSAGNIKVYKNMNFQDNDILQMGTSGDLNIYHDGSNSYIKDTGTGNLIIQGSSRIELKAANDEKYLRAIVNGAVSLYYDDVEKLATTSTGVSVTGLMQASTVGVTNIVTNKVVKFNGTILDDSNITDTGSLITLGSATTATGKLTVNNNVSGTTIAEFNNSNTNGHGVKITIGNNDSNRAAFQIVNSAASQLYFSNYGQLMLGYDYLTTPSVSYKLAVAGTSYFSSDATFAGNVVPSTNPGGSLGLGSKQWGALHISSSAAITWGNGDAAIAEGEVSNYSLSFKTYDGTNLSRALLLEGNNDATFTTQAFATVATSTGDASSTLTTKGYVDGLITGATIYRGTWDPDVALNSGYGSPNLNTVTQTSGYYYICSADGTATPNGATTEPNTWSTGDWVIWNDDIGAAGEWQKIDNSSVLSGAGTGQTVALWEGANSVTDSETLGNAPITVSGT